MILPFVLSEPGNLYCLAVAPTVIMSLMFVVLYLVDQVHDLAEQLYIITQIVVTVVALIANLLCTTPVGAVYGVFLTHLLIALAIDQYYVFRERGFSAFKNWPVLFVINFLKAFTCIIPIFKPIDKLTNYWILTYVVVKGSVLIMWVLLFQWQRKSFTSCLLKQIN